jgi:hypothetical protein
VAVAKKPVLKDIVFTLPKDKPAYKVVSVLQEQFKSPETRKADGTVVAPRKAQGRLLIDAVVEAVFQYASAETLAALADEVKGKGEPIKLDYRLDKSGDTEWKIIDVNVGGLWLVQNYRTQFAQELAKGGVDGLIATLTERNKAAGKS